MQPFCTTFRLAFLALVLGTVAAPPSVGSQPPKQTPPGSPPRTADSAAVAAALNHFLTSFENLDWGPFRAAFSDSASIFHPAAEMAERVTGPRGIDSTFRAVFAEIRAHATAGPPYHRLIPRDLRIQSLSPGLVLVTFQLLNEERLARRTVIFRHEDVGWRILHLHASNIATKR